MVPKSLGIADRSLAIFSRSCASEGAAAACRGTVPHLSIVLG
jgi:hypothetical protein